MCSGSGTPGSSTSSSGKMGNSELTEPPVQTILRQSFDSTRELQIRSLERARSETKVERQTPLPVALASCSPCAVCAELTCRPPNDTKVAMEMAGKVVVVTGASMGI